MSTDFTLYAKGREDTGKGASRRLRRLSAEIPGIVYGGGKTPAQVSLSQREVNKALQNEAFYSHVIALTIDGKAEDVVLKDMQRHPSKPIILHMDFLRVNKTTVLHSKVPLHFINEDTCVGIKVGGGIIAHSMTELDIHCLPQNLPEYIEVDMAAVEVGQTVHISDLVLPKGVESVALSHGPEHDLPVATVNKSKTAFDTDDGGADSDKEAS